MLRRSIAVFALAIALLAELANAQKCGVWNGNQNWLCDATVPCAQPSLCAVIAPPVNGALAECVCTNCTFVDSTAAGTPPSCVGTCPYTRVCTLSSAAPRTCTCALPPPTPPPAPTPPATTAVTTPPPPTPPPPCGQYTGHTLDSNGEPNENLCDPPQCSANTKQLCGLLVPIDPTTPPKCECTSCNFNTDTQLCTGTCINGMACARVPGTTTCQCAKAATPPTPTLPPVCGQWKGGVVTDAGTTAFLCSPPRCAANPTQLCGLDEPPSATAPSTCACSTCLYDSAHNTCLGKCPLGTVCQLAVNAIPLDGKSYPVNVNTSLPPLDTLNSVDATITGVGTGVGTPPIYPCRCAPPPPVTPPPCGQFTGDTRTYLCEGAGCPNATIPGTTFVQQRRCGVLEPYDAAKPATCACTTCHFNPTTKACSGTCQLRHRCTKLANAEACECRREVHVIVIGILVVIALVVLVLIPCCTLGGGGGGGGGGGLLGAALKSS